LNLNNNKSNGNNVDEALALKKAHENELIAEVDEKINQAKIDLEAKLQKIQTNSLNEEQILLADNNLSPKDKKTQLSELKLRRKSDLICAKKDNKSLIEKYKEEKHNIIDPIMDYARIPNPSRNIKSVKKMKNFSDGKKWINITIMCASVIGLLLLWLILSNTIPKVETFISTPQKVWAALVARINLGWYWEDVWMSFQRVLIGFSVAVLCSIPMAFLMAWFKTFRAIVDPWLQFFRTIPPIAIIPIMIAVFGTGEQPKYAIIFIAVFLSMTVTIYQGIRNVDLTLIKAAYTFGSKDGNIFLDVIIPSAFPFILTAMRLGVGAALTTLIAAEMTGASEGLGALIQIASGSNRIDVVMMGIVSIGVIGFTLDRILLVVEKLLTRWK
jgi:NitT/TauT family transport system permease protein